MASGIYKILNTKTNKFYIGQASNLSRRFIVHKSQFIRNIHPNIYLQRAWNKYSFWFFEFIILEYCELEKLVEREQFYIDTLKPEYNLCLKAGSPNLGKNLTKEHREKISKAGKGRKFSIETRAKMSAWQIGRKMSDEAKQNMFKAKLGNQSRRLKLKWPCANGCRCPCENCRQKRRIIKKEWDDNRKVGFAILENINVVNINV